MKTQATLKSYVKFLMIPAMVALIIFSCKKSGNSDTIATPATPPDLTTKVNASVSGFITDENDAALPGATVQFGNATLVTDKYGYFEVLNTDVVKEAATVIVIKQGYFKGIKTYTASAGKKTFFRIKLIRKNIQGTVIGSAGGTVTLSNGLSIVLPANGIVNATTNAVYTGTVNVAAYFINPTSEDIASTMPGDLRGINTNGNLQLLSSYSMAAVELTGSGGELLQIATGSKANLTFPIPAAIVATAPATIPLWYFDEIKGLWKQEGSAAKSGNNYIGDVSHFSFWNCDVPNNYVPFNCTLVNQNNLPIQNVSVKLSVLSNPATKSYGYTDSTGYVSGNIPANATLLMEVFSNGNCSTPIYTQTITTTTVAVSLNSITINTTSFLAAVSGTVTSCSNAPVNNGYVIVKNGALNFRYPVIAGAFAFNTFLCSSPSSVYIIAEDVAGSQQSPSSNYTLNSGANNIGNIQACGVAIQQYVNFSIDGTPYTFSPPADTVDFSIHGPFFHIAANRFATPSIGLALEVDNNGIAAGTNQNLLLFLTSQANDNLSIPNPITAHITEYGTAGQFCAGNFTGIFKGQSPAYKLYNITCNFRVKIK